MRTRRRSGASSAVADRSSTRLVPRPGFEPGRGCPQRCLRPPRLPVPPPRRWLVASTAHRTTAGALGDAGEVSTRGEPEGLTRQSRTCWDQRVGTETEDGPRRTRFILGLVEATIGFEPMNRGFADLRVKPLHHVAPWHRSIRGPVGFSLAAPRGFEPRLTDPKSAVLPLDEGAAVPGWVEDTGGSGAEDGTRTRDPHLGKVMLYQLSHFRSMTDQVMVPRARFELATPRFSVACSTN